MQKIKNKFAKLLLPLILVPCLVFAAPKYISPNNDGIQDELVIPLNISEKRYIQAWSLVIMDENHKVVRTIGNKIALPTKLNAKSFFKQLVSAKSGCVVPETVSWNGAMDNGETAPDGLYYYYITATDDNGNTGKSKELQVYIDTIAPEIELVQPSDKIFGEGEKISLKIKQTGSKEDEWDGVFRSVDGKEIRVYKWQNSEPMEFSWFGTDDANAQIKDGVYSYEISATDRAGNKSSATIQNIIYSADKPATNLVVNGSRYFSPKTDSSIQDVKFSVSIPVPDPRTGNKLVEWAVDIEDSNGKVVKSFNQNLNGANPPSSIVFDGTDSSGKLLADGEYKANVTAKYLNGYVPAKISSPVLVLDTEKPVAQIRPSVNAFGAGSKASVTYTVQIAPSAGAPVNEWKAEVKTEDKSKTVKTYKFGSYVPENIVWNGIADNGEIAPKGKYTLVLTGTDLAGNIGGGESADLVTFDTTEAKLLLAMSDSAFSPNGNGVKDTISFMPVTQTKDIVSYNFVIKGKGGKVVYTVNSSTALPVNFVWDGKDSSKILCADGTYTAELSVTAANGSTATAVTSEFALDTVSPKLVASTTWNCFAPKVESSKQQTLPVKISECTSEALWTAEVKDSKNASVRKFTWSGKADSITWDGLNESGNIVPDGKYTLELYSTDDAGNSFKTQIAGITVDTREPKAYITSEYEGISPNGDSAFDTQKFDIKTSVKDNLVSWSVNVRREDGKAVYTWTEKDSANLPETITWNGADKDGKVVEGTLSGTLDIAYANGTSVSAYSAPFVCTATPPQLKVQTATANSGENGYFSPDNDGVDDDLFIKLTGSTKAKIKDWSFIVYDPKGKEFWRNTGKSQITERLVWDGLSNVQKDANGNADRVQSAMDYPYKFTVTDNLGMTSSIEGVIPVDVLVIREGNVLKMAVPSIIFEADAANFQNVSAKLSKEQVNKNVAILKRIAEILKKFKDYKVLIVGHANKLTDNPDEETTDNMREWGRGLMPLSKERADAIKAYLSKKGVNASSLSTEGLGGTKPVVNPKDKDNNWKNRRVEFILNK